MVHIIITVQDKNIVFHQFETKFTTPTEKEIANVLRVYLPTWLARKASEFKARFRIIR